MKQFVGLLLVAATAFLAVPASQARDGSGLASYEAWQSACSQLPANRVLRGQVPPRQLLPLGRYADFEAALAVYLDQAAQRLAEPGQWLDRAPAAGFFDTRPAAKTTFRPFAQRLIVPPGSEIFFRGDLHGDVHSLLANLAWLNERQYLDGFAIQRTNFYMVFLGDYTDRGAYGLEVLYTLLRLKIANPERVFLARGNHEEVSMVARYGFLAEGQAKYGKEFDPARLYRIYDFLPVVIYTGVGDNYIQCNHGGMEPGYNPARLLNAPLPVRFELLGAIRQKKYLLNEPDWLADADEESRDLARRAFIDFIPENPTSPMVLGFMWNDFSLLSTEPQFALDPGRAFVYGDKATQHILAVASGGRCKLQAVFRGHQHSSVLNPMMRRLVASGGVFQHWQTNDSPALLNRPVTAIAAALRKPASQPIPPGSVWTFNVSPDSAYGEGCRFAFDTFGLLTVSARFEEWRLCRINLPVSP